jgi:protein TonB
MDSKKSIELIILEVLGCLDIDERGNLQLLKETDENFPWKALSQYQNLSALLPSILKISEIPPAAVKARMISKLNESVSSVESFNKETRFTSSLGKKDSEKEQLEEILNKNKIDWGSLAVSNPTTKAVTGYEEVKPKAPTIKRDTVQQHVPNEFKENEKLIISVDEELIEEPGTKIESSSKLKKYVLVSIILFMISLSLFGYIFVFNQEETTETIAEIKSDAKVETAPVEEFVYNNFRDLENNEQVVNVQPVENQNNAEEKTESKTETKTETIQNISNKSVMPKAPPKLPEPIDAPLIETTQISSTEEAKEEQKTSTPPKEIIEESEEPTYFVAVEEMPQPIGGLQAIQSLIQYPEIAKRAGVEGKVFVRAFVDEKGNVTNAEIVKGIGGGCDEAALDAILKTKFTPGKQRGKPIKVQVTVPVLFRL